MLARIKENRSNVLCPTVDAVSEHTTEYIEAGGQQIGGFSWNLFFIWTNILEKDKINRAPTDPIR